ncbi:MAG: NAD(P)H-hydrate dehydratase [Porticoccaceae bacterium]|nr:NAD(P)H-hydrate dehydratase [Porticoccaceae bacterium]
MSHIVIQDALYKAKSVRELDHLAIQQMAIPSIVLMKRAGRAAYDELIDAWGQPSTITVFCGSGNNAGDGYIVAALAAEKGFSARVIELATVDKLSSDAALARDYSAKAGVSFQVFSEDLDLFDGVIVDALLGTGFQPSVDSQLREPYAEAIQCINNAALPVLAIDLPSGLSSDTGSAADAAVKADITVTFIAAKQGMFTGRGPALCGEIIYHSLDIDETLFEQQSSSSQLMNLDDLLEAYPDRDADAYKNQFGHTMVVGGDLGFGGAVVMAAESALKTGSGLVSVATRPQHVSAILARQPEIMASGIISGQELEPLLDKPSVLIVGPGLGRSPWSEQLLQKAVATGLPMVVDADALNIIAEGRVVPKPNGSNWVMTPHPAEAARLLNITVAEVQADRFTAVRKLQQKFNGVVLLKGAGTLIASADSDQIMVCPYGNPSMATAGMGDLLSGIIGGLLAQGLAPFQAAQLGCCLHSAAADLALEERGARGLSATDITAYLRGILNGADL